MRKIMYLIKISGLIAVFNVGFFGIAAAGENGLSAQDEIEDLMSCYAYAADAIGRAVNATIPVPPPFDSTDANIHEDPNFAEGLQLYRNCMAEDWVLAIEVDGVPIELPPGFLAPGPLAFANLVNGGARQALSRNTQHVFGSISSSVHGKEGTVKAYAIIHTMFLPESPSSGNVNVATSTYTSDVVRRKGKWLLQKTTINATSSASTAETP